jgi:NitT/TauT family transport system substrate-binding protein
MKHAQPLFLCLASLCAMWLIACAPSATLPPTTQRTALKVSWNTWPGTYPLEIAEKMGFFAKHGVRVEPVFVGDSYSTIVSDFAAHKLDGVTLVIGDLLPLAVDDKVKAVMLTDGSEGADVIIATSDITSIRALKGKRIGAGLGTFSELFVREMLKKGGLTPNDVELVNVSGDNVPNEMPVTIQAGHSWEPIVSEGIANGDHVLFTSSETPGLIVNVLAFQESVVKERPQEVRAFIAAWFEAEAWWQAHPAEGNALIVTATGLKPETISTDGIRFFTLQDNLKAFRQGTDTSSVYYTANLYLNFFTNIGSLTTRPDINLMFDPSFLN